METIHKYPIAGEPGTVMHVETLDGPVLHVGLDPNGLACIWVHGDTGEGSRFRALALVGTGWPLDKSPINILSKHLGSFVQGPFVWHLWEV